MCSKFDDVIRALENYRFCRKSGDDAYIKGGGFMLFVSPWRIAYENRYVIHPCVRWKKKYFRS